MATLNTGAAGFIGMSAAERLLARGDEIVGIDVVNDYHDPQLKHDRPTRLANAYGDTFRFVKVDFADMAALGAALAPFAFDRIVHLDAQAGVRDLGFAPTTPIRVGMPTFVRWYRDYGV